MRQQPHRPQTGALAGDLLRAGSTGPLRSVPLPEAKIIELLDHLDLQEPQGGRRVDARRQLKRHPFRHLAAPLTVVHPGGSVARFVVPTRDISDKSISFLHGGYLHTGTHCMLDLPTLAGGSLTTEGAVVRCDHLLGAVHQIAVLFYQPIDVKLFVALESDVENEAVDPSEISGQILLVDDQAFEARLLAHHLRAAAVELRHAATIDQARELLQEVPFDLVLCDMGLKREPGAQAIRALRSWGYKGPIIALSGEWRKDALMEARNAGAAAVLPKPYDPNRLLRNIASFLKASNGASDPNQPIYSALEKDQATRSLIKQFIRDARRLADELATCIVKEDFEGVRQLSLTLKEAGGGYGFSELLDAAQAAITALDASFSVAESLQELRRLQSVCERLQSRDDQEEKPSSEAA